MQKDSINAGWSTTPRSILEDLANMRKILEKQEALHLQERECLYVGPNSYKWLLDNGHILPNGETTKKFWDEFDRQVKMVLDGTIPDDFKQPPHE